MAITPYEKYEIMKSFYEEGAVIEHTPVNFNEWIFTEDPTWEWERFHYRIKKSVKELILMELERLQETVEKQGGIFDPITGHADLEAAKTSHKAQKHIENIRQLVVENIPDDST